jgi:hypothetical protein
MLPVLDAKEPVFFHIACVDVDDAEFGHMVTLPASSGDLDEGDSLRQRIVLQNEIENWRKLR